MHSNSTTDSSKSSLPRWQLMDADSPTDETAEVIEQLSEAKVPVAFMISNDSYLVSLVVSIDGLTYQMPMPASAADKIGAAMQTVAMQAERMKSEAISTAATYAEWTALLALHRMATGIAGDTATDAVFTLIQQTYKAALESRKIIDPEIMAGLLAKLEETAKIATQEYYSATRK